MHLTAFSYLKSYRALLMSKISFTQSKAKKWTSRIIDVSAVNMMDVNILEQGYVLIMRLSKPIYNLPKNWKVQLK